MEIIALTIICPICGMAHTVCVKLEDYNAWQAGKVAQSAFPYLTAEKREQLISHLCPACQVDFFGAEDD